MVFVPISGTQHLKSSNSQKAESDKGVSYYVDEVTFGLQLRVGLVARRPTILW